MITKTVSSGQRSTTATISEETKFIFPDRWEFFHVQNMGTGVMYISMKEGSNSNDDGVIAVLAGGTACSSHNFPASTIYVTSASNTDVVQIIGSNSAISPFKSAGGGGGSGGTVTWGSIIGKPTFADIALSGNYADLINDPAIPIVDSELSLLSSNTIKNMAVAEALQDLENELDSITGGVKYVGYFGTLTERNTYTDPLKEGYWCTVNTDSDYANKKTKYVYAALTSAWKYNGEVSETVISLDDTAGLGDTSKALSADQIVKRINTQTAALQSAINLCAPVSSAHTHTNKSVIDKFSESDGKPLFDGLGIGGNIIVDPALSVSSANPVQNKAVAEALNGKAVTDHIQAANKGGTGQTVYTVGDILYANSATTLAKLPAGTAGTVLKSGGAGVAPAWGDTSGSGLTETLLFSGACTASTVYALSSAFTNYKFLAIVVEMTSSMTSQAMVINCSNIAIDAGYLKATTYIYSSGAAAVYQYLSFANALNFKMSANVTIKIYGVN